MAAQQSDVIVSRVRNVDIPVMPLSEYVLGAIPDGMRDRPAFVEGPTGRVLTFGALKDAVRRFSAGLVQKGFKKGDVFAIYSPNVPEFAIVLHGVASVGGILTTANPMYTPSELQHQLQGAGAIYLVTIAGLADKALEAANGTGVKHVFVFGDDAPPGTAPFKTLLADEHAPAPKVAIDPKRDVVVLPYSSGTTGLPKGVELTHYNLVSNLCQVAAPSFIHLSPDDTLIAVLPFFHSYGMVVILNLALRYCSRIVTMPKFEPQQYLELVQKYSATILHVVPPIVLFLAKHPMVGNYNLSSVKEIFSGAAPLGKELSEALIKRLGIKLLRQGYGMTELSPATHITPSDKVKLGSIGVLLPNHELKLVDVQTGQPVGAGKEGEIWVRGPNVMKGYLNNPQATAETIDKDGFLHTGDVAVMDEDGHFFIVDRVKELIKFKGYQVAPAELEAILLSHPMIADAAVIPKRDLEAGEIPKAFVVKKDASLTEHEVMEFVEKHVAPHKKVREVAFIEAIPKAPSGKILRRILRDKEKQAVEKAGLA